MTDRTGSRGPLRVRVENGVAWIVLDRPAARNALSVDLVRRLRRAMQEVDADPVVDVVVLTGSGTTFCAGLDFRELVSSPAEMLTELSAVPGCPWVPISKPVVGAINGPAVSGGLELALHCDFLVASAGAGFADTHALVGGVPGWGLTARLPAQIGFAAARRMSLTGEMLDAAEALRRGLITEVVSAEDLVPRVTEIAQSTRRGQPEARGRVLSGYRDAENVVAQVQRRSERAHFEGWVESRGGFLVEIDRASVARVRERKEELVRTSESTRPDLPIDALVPLRDLRTVGRVVRELDELSYERVLFPESTHDVFTTIAAAAQHSGEMTLASAVAVAFARNPMTVAYVAWDLQEITGGRFVLGLGSQVRGHIVRRYGIDQAGTDRADPEAGLRRMFLTSLPPRIDEFLSGWGLVRESNCRSLTGPNGPLGMSGVGPC